MCNKNMVLFATLLSFLSLPMEAFAADVHLAWDPPDQPGSMIGYRIYYCDDSTDNCTQPRDHLHPVECGNVTDFVVTGLSTNVDYYFVVRSYNDSAEGLDSNEVMWNSTMPSIKILSPTSDSSYDPPGTPGQITIAGTASDDAGISTVTWANSRGGSGAASGTTNWTIDTLGLVCGENNVITVTVEDMEGNTATDSIDLNVQPCNPDNLILTSGP